MDDVVDFSAALKDVHQFRVVNEVNGVAGVRGDGLKVTKDARPTGLVVKLWQETDFLWSQSSFWRRRVEV